MKEQDNRFLPHLKDALPQSAHGYMSSGYSIALEGWRRGLNLRIKVSYQKRKSKVIEFILSNEKRSHYFQITRGDLVSREAIKVCVNKDQTKKYLLKNGIETPEGGIFGEESSTQDLLNYANSLGYPLVLKPTDGTGGKGVIANIKNENELSIAIAYVRGKLNFKDLIIEKYFSGEDHRLYVVGDKVVGAFKRDPASVRGNGIDNIEVLLRKKNEDRMKVPSLQNKPIKVNTETKNLLDKHGYTMKSVPKSNELIFLKTKNNVSSGGEAVDVTDELTEEMKEIAVSATKAIPTLVQAGVDMMIDKESNSGAVLEINSRAHIRTHLFPSYGKARDIPSAIIDYYFPETRDYNRKNKSKMYFDFDFVFDAFNNGTAGYIEIPPIPRNITLKRYTLVSLELPLKFKDWIKTTAVKNKVNGFIKKFKSGNHVLVIGGDNKDVTNFITTLKKKIATLDSQVELIPKVRSKPIMQGFHLIEGEPYPTASTAKIVSRSTSKEDEYFKVGEDRISWVNYKN